MPGWKRWVALLVGVTLEVAQWGLALAMFVTGAVMWRDWHALAREGVPLKATVDGCKWSAMHTRKRLLGRSSSGDGGTARPAPERWRRQPLPKRWLRAERVRRSVCPFRVTF